MTYLAGKIIGQHQACCGICFKTKTTSNSSTMYLGEKQFREMKWKKTKKYGWICPNHKKEGREWV